MARPFDHVLRLPGAQPEDVALAIAAEFEQVDPPRPTSASTASRPASDRSDGCLRASAR